MRGSLEFGEFFPEFIGAVPRWQDQNDTERELVRLIIGLDDETCPEGRARFVVGSMINYRSNLRRPDTSTLAERLSVSPQLIE